MEDDRPDHRLDPEQDDAVRRLLAESRHEEPIPDDLAARLDRVLAELATEGPVPRPRVVDLATQRRRRRARNLLAAAAAVAVVGVGLGQLDLGSVTMSDSDAGGSSGGSAADYESDGAAHDESAPAAASESQAFADGGGPVSDRHSVEVARKPVTVGDEDFAAVAEARAAESTGTAAELGAGASAYRASWFTCKRAPFGKGRLVAVRYQGTSAVLAVRPPTGDSVVVELLQCGTATVLRSATVPLP